MATPTTGNATIGLNAQLLIDDFGNGVLPGNGTHVKCVNIESITPSSPKLNMIESKPLDLSGNTIKQIPGLFTPGEVTVSWELVNATGTGNGIGQHSRLEALRVSRTEAPCRITVPTADGGGNITKNFNAIVGENAIQPVTADGKTMCQTTLNITGVQS